MNSEIAQHCLLRKKDRGASRKLVGDVTLINLFVDDLESQWETVRIEMFTQKVKHAAQLLEREAAAHGVELRIRTANGRVRVNRICRPPACDWAKEVLKEYGKSNTEEFQEYYEGVFRCDEAPVQFVFNKEFRSCASSADMWYPQWDEFSMLMADASAWTIVHELLHQFGAVDQYFPQIVKEASERWLPDNYMNRGYAVDSLTAFLIGWDAEPDARARGFLAQTEKLTMEDIRQAIDQEWEKKR